MADKAARVKIVPAISGYDVCCSICGVIWSGWSPLGATTMRDFHQYDLRADEHKKGGNWRGSA